MKLLSRTEELLLLAIWRLQDNAYTVTIQKQLQTVTGKTWSFGALFVSLDRLVQRGYLTSDLGEATPDRGGRRRRMYLLTAAGKQALLEIRRIETAMWTGLPDLIFSGPST
ncbi:MAG TPA: PadR family transcriptional regulator [Rhodothermales bacterium]|nr:PadR family transcriptional regulator [Rhodothermales bacterium]